MPETDNAHLEKRKENILRALVMLGMFVQEDRFALAARCTLTLAALLFAQDEADAERAGDLATSFDVTGEAEFVLERARQLAATPREPNAIPVKGDEE